MMTKMQMKMNVQRQTWNVERKVNGIVCRLQTTPDLLVCWWTGLCALGGVTWGHHLLVPLVSDLESLGVLKFPHVSPW